MRDYWYMQLDSWNLTKSTAVFARKHWKCRLQNGGRMILSRLSVLKETRRFSFCTHRRGIVVVGCRPWLFRTWVERTDRGRVGGGDLRAGRGPLAGWRTWWCHHWKQCRTMTVASRQWGEHDWHLVTIYMGCFQDVLIYALHGMATQWNLYM